MADIPECSFLLVTQSNKINNNDKYVCLYILLRIKTKTIRYSTTTSRLKLQE